MMAQNSQQGLLLRSGKRKMEMENDNGTVGRYLEMGWQYSGHLRWLALVG